MTISVARFESENLSQWNEFVEASNSGTIFHRLDFLAYHGQRFRNNEHHLAFYKGQTLYGVMPLAIFDDDSGQCIAKSPYGGSFGGPVFMNVLNYSDSHNSITALFEYLSTQSVDEIYLTLPLSIIYGCYSDTFSFVLLERGFDCVAREISSNVCLDYDTPVSVQLTSRARNMVRKARKAGVATITNAPIEDFWSVIEDTFAKHGTQPTHTLADFSWLNHQFPDRVYVDVAYLDGQPIAGIGYIEINNRVNSSFYLCQKLQYQHLQAQSLLVCQGLERSQENGFKWFDFGTSSIHMKGRSNIFRFKESFGAVGNFRETYRYTS